MTNDSFPDGDPVPAPDAQPVPAPRKSDNLNVELFRQYVALHFEIETDVATLKAKKARLDAMEQVCMMALAETGISSIPLVHDGQPVTVYKTSTLRSGKREDVETPACVDFLKSVDMGWLVAEAWNAQRLSGWVREELAEGRALPPGFENYFKVAEDPSVNVIRATREGSKSQRAASNYRELLKNETTKGS